MVDEAAARMEEEGKEILNIGNPYPFSFSAPQEVLDMLSNIRTSQGYSDSKGIFSAKGDHAVCTASRYS